MPYCTIKIAYKIKKTSSQVPECKDLILELAAHGNNILNAILVVDRHVKVDIIEDLLLSTDDIFPL